MWLVVGLGNPGTKYAGTRHNVGFLVADLFAEKHGLEFREKTGYRICDGSIDGERIVVMEPLTFMNKSGSAVRRLVDKHFLSPSSIIVVHDDLDMDAGRLKIRKSGSSGGHKGVESIIQSIGSREFVRVKIGIGRDGEHAVESYVLSKFRRDELPVIRAAVERAADSVSDIIGSGIEMAMNRYNRA
ncbi:MAG: aminoacyl-tRNA hydrolase [Nitrospiraceae bacterium]|nr:aminoacyl-tRNA hydrolase [Nitrospiraceae bacterium]